MRAAHYTGPGSITVAEAAAVPPRAGEVQIAVAYTGICGTDLHILHGHMDQRVRPWAVLGHEMSGRIRALGADVSGWQLDDPVTVMPTIWCGQCPACRAGNSHVCHHLTFVGIDAPGSMQAYWTVPADLLVRLPASLPLAHAALIEPVAVAVHDVRRSGLRLGEHAVVVGGGPVGVLIGLVARRAGAHVLLVEPDQYRRSVADGLGLRTVDPAAVEVGHLVEEWSGGAGAAVAFEVSGTEPGLVAAVRALAVRGRMVLVGIHPTPRPVDLHRFFWRELSLVGARLYDRSDFDEAVRLVAGGAVPTEPLISRIEPLEAARQAFQALEDGAGVMKVLVDCQAASR
ncbi:alcohol dehydrogenase catalytic domain-containing protein [Plantactinospora sp. ZYX-F-223]|uniref:zinc-dependent alcohol dehydrogenase n=1 Tax=Plantactinospora sp. ZYX-F-223 TaxID=3144103 RepID=UPI0031FBB8E9